MRAAVFNTHCNKSFQAIHSFDCTGTDNQVHNNQEKNMQKTTLILTNWIGLRKTKHIKPEPTSHGSPVRTAHMSVLMAVHNYDTHSIRHRTVLIIFSFILQTTVIAQIVRWMGELWKTSGFDCNFSR